MLDPAEKKLIKAIKNLDGGWEKVLEAFITSVENVAEDWRDEAEVSGDDMLNDWADNYDQSLEYLHRALELLESCGTKKGKRA